MLIDDLEKGIVVFRHGQTDWNLAGRCQGGESDIPINSQGREQALILAEKMRRHNFSYLFTSPLSRALETAKIIQSTTQAEVKTIPNLIELLYGDAAGKLSKDARQEYHEVYEDWFGKTLDEAPNAGFPNGETRTSFVHRIMKAFQEIASNEFRLAGISTHSGVIWNFIHHIGGPRLDKINFCEGHIIEIDRTRDATFLYKGVL